MTPRQEAAMEARREKNLRESVMRSFKHGDYRITSEDLWFLALPRGTKEGIKRAWDQHKRKEKP